MNRQFFRYLLSAASAASLLLSGCAVVAPKPPPKPAIPPPPRPHHTWDAEKAKTENGPPRVIVDLSDQRAYFFKGVTLIGDTKCSTGKKTFETPPGEYEVIQKNKDHVSNLYGNFVDAEGTIVKRDVDMSKMTVPEGLTFAGAKMPYFMRFHGGYGMHSGHVPNRPASHGCVRLPRIMAERFFKNAKLGVPVTVQE